MQWTDQGTGAVRCYSVVPRTLSFLVADEALLLLRGAPDKRLWAGKLNGVGGHLLPGEDPLSGAKREILEETGLVVETLTLRAVLHIARDGSAQGVLVLVFLGQAPTRAVRAGREGTLDWYPLAHLPWAEMVEDLPLLLPRLLEQGEQPCMVYAAYRTDETGRMTFEFQSAPV